MCYAIVSRFICGHLILNTAHTCEWLTECRPDLSVVRQTMACPRCQAKTRCVGVMYAWRCGCPYDHVVREWTCRALQEAARARGETHFHTDPHAVVFPLSATWCGDAQCPRPYSLSRPDLLSLDIEDEQDLPPPDPSAAEQKDAPGSEAA